MNPTGIWSTICSSYKQIKSSTIKETCRWCQTFWVGTYINQKKTFSFLAEIAPRSSMLVVNPPSELKKLEVLLADLSQNLLGSVSGSVYRLGQKDGVDTAWGPEMIKWNLWQDMWALVESSVVCDMFCFRNKYWHRKQYQQMVPKHQGLSSRDAGSWHCWRLLGWDSLLEMVHVILVVTIACCAGGQPNQCPQGLTKTTPRNWGLRDGLEGGRASIQNQSLT